ncbi:MAG TPA: hypothetical protein VFC39_12590 [Acidobacteriaceae bacterium]|nr:hypothetical protein [Acidobacteriaceae bacterium]
MTLLSSTQRIIRISLAGGLALGLATLAGCGVGNGAPATGFDTTVGHVQGTIHGGPNPVGGATVTLYATGDTSGNSTGYGVGQSLQTAKSDASGNFSFEGGYTCPANQYAYMVATGGKTGSNNVNPNSVLMAALGPCSGVSSSTFVIINELTTVAAGYTLSNFMNITGNAVTGYVVGIGAPATNNAPNGCVNNSYYGTGTCPTTAAAGLAHAFANAAALANSSGGSINATTKNGAIVPVQLINTLGNILQACVNSNGGGTDLAAGAPTTTTSTAGGTTNDGTPCGKLFSYISYTADGTQSGTLTAPGNTLSAIQSLAKRPTGSPTQFNSSCDSGSTGTTSAVTCIFNMGTPVGIYQTSMTVAPTDWTLGISYPKGSFSTAANGVTCAGSPTTNGALYPFMAATDINDNVVILNGDASTASCYNLLTVGFDGTPLEGNGFDNNNAIPIWVSTDAFGHAIVPVHGTVENGVRIFGATDANLPLVGTIPAVLNTATNFPFWSGVDQNDGIYLSDSPATKTTTDNFGYLPVSGTESHSTPVYGTPVTPTPINTNKLNPISVDVNGVGFTTTNSSSSGVTQALVMGSATDSSLAFGGVSSSGIITATDNAGNIWNLSNAAGGVNGGSSVVAVLSPGVGVYKQSYTVAGGVVTLGAGSLVTTLTPGAVKPQAGQIDGNNVIWYADIEGALTTSPSTVINPGSLHGYDTVNNFDTHVYNGCKFATSTSTACGSQPTDATYPSNSPYLLYGTRGLAIDSAGSIWLVNGTQGQVNEIIGLAAPTWPLFIHNGTSNKP